MKRKVLKPAYKTRYGSMFHCDTAEFFHSKQFEKLQNKAQLVFTSPPYPLLRKKKYGNLKGRAYSSWLTKYASALTAITKKNGSIVIEIGNAWEPGLPTMSTSVIEGLLGFLKAGGLHLCQEFIWYNPARLPSPAQWVNVKRIRVKDAFTRIWWMSPSTHPKADNRNVLKDYSKSMKSLLKTQQYNSGKRPSQHNIGAKSFLTDHGGAIPPNVIEDPHNFIRAANTRTSDDYQNYCRENEIVPHPARMPSAIAEFFIRFLTDKRDLVVDPFAGSNTTGIAAENLKRRWVSIERNESYVRGSRGRFIKPAKKGSKVGTKERSKAGRKKGSKAGRKKSRM